MAAQQLDFLRAPPRGAGGLLAHAARHLVGGGATGRHRPSRAGPPATGTAPHQREGSLRPAHPAARRQPLRPAPQAGAPDAALADALVRQGAHRDPSAGRMQAASGGPGTGRGPARHLHARRRGGPALAGRDGTGARRAQARAAVAAGRIAGIAAPGAGRLAGPVRAAADAPVPPLLQRRLRAPADAPAHGPAHARGDRRRRGGVAAVGGRPGRRPHTALPGGTLAAVRRSPNGMRLTGARWRPANGSWRTVGAVAGEQRAVHAGPTRWVMWAPTARCAWVRNSCPAIRGR